MSQTNEGIEIVRTLDPAYDLYLLDHQLDGKPVMPLAMTLELLAEVAATACPNMSLSAVRDLHVLRGIALDDGPMAIRIHAVPSKRVDGGVNLALRIESLGQCVHTYYTAVGELHPKLRWTQLPRFSVINPCPLGMTVEDAYEKWLFHGPLFAGIVDVEAVGDNGIVARLSPSSPRRCLAQGNGSRWLIDPVVVDSGLQLLILWARTHLDMTPLPSRLGCYHFNGQASDGELRCEVRIRSVENLPSLHADLLFHDATGALVGWMEDMEVTCSRALNRLSQMRPRIYGAES